MRIYCDSSTREACFILEGQEAMIVPYSEPVTNNVGEYRAVILAFEEAKRLKLKQVELLTDSQLVVCQAAGIWKCTKPHLLPLRNRVRALLFSFGGGAQLLWVARGDNLAGKILDAKK